MNWIDGYLKYTDNTEPADLYREWVAVSSVAAVMQRKCRLDWGHMTFFPNMYIVLVGSSGVRKGTALGPAARMLYEIDNVRLSSETTTKEALVRELLRNRATDINPVTNVISMHNSLTIFSEELTVFLGYNNLELIGYLTDWYDCGKGKDGIWTYETVARGKEKVIGIWVNLIGATTPEMIQNALPRDAIGGGLTSRMIFVYEERRGKIVPFPFLTDAEIQLGEELFDLLNEMSRMKIEFKVEERFLKDRYIKWYTDNAKHPKIDHPKFAGYNQRRPVHLLKLCMIHNFARFGEGIIMVEDFDRALDLLERTERNMSKTFSGVGEADKVAVLSRIMGDIFNFRKITRSDLLRRHYHDVTGEELTKMLETIRSMDYCFVKITEHETFITYNENYKD